jgi:hypothetical protein
MRINVGLVEDLPEAEVESVSASVIYTTVANSKTRSDRTVARDAVAIAAAQWQAAKVSYSQLVDHPASGEEGDDARVVLPSLLASRVEERPRTQGRVGGSAQGAVGK